jgi:hypothetical protein
MVDRDRIGGGLRHPVIERVLPAESNDFLGAQYVRARARL